MPVFWWFRAISRSFLAAEMNHVLHCGINSTILPSVQDGSVRKRSDLLIKSISIFRICSKNICRWTDMKSARSPNGCLSARFKCWIIPQYMQGVSTSW